MSTRIICDFCIILYYIIFKSNQFVIFTVSYVRDSFEPENRLNAPIAQGERESGLVFVEGNVRKRVKLGQHVLVSDRIVGVGPSARAHAIPGQGSMKTRTTPLHTVTDRYEGWPCTSGVNCSCPAVTSDKMADYRELLRVPRTFSGNSLCISYDFFFFLRDRLLREIPLGIPSTVSPGRRHRDFAFGTVRIVVAIL